MNRLIKYMLLGLAIIFTFSFHSCINEDRDGCETLTTREYLLYVKVVDPFTGEDIFDTEDVEFVDLFIFQTNGRYIDHIKVSADSIKNNIPIKLSLESNNDMLISAWGNLKENQVLSEITENCFIDNLSVQLKTTEEGYAMCPDDLFFCLKQLSVSSAAPKASVYTEEIPLSRKNARMHITVKGLERNADNPDYYFTVCKQHNGYDFRGNPIHNPTTEIKEYGIFEKSFDFCTPDAFNLIHVASDEQFMTVNLHRNSATKSDGIIVSVDRDSEGNLISPKAGETTNILIDLTQSDAHITIRVTPWDEVYNWSTW